MTDAERVAKVPWQMRLHIHKRNREGEGQNRLAEALGISKRTIAAVIYEMDLRMAGKSYPSPQELWNQPQTPGWRVHGEIRR